jgi:hypothetical protein
MVLSACARYQLSGANIPTPHSFLRSPAPIFIIPLSTLPHTLRAHSPPAFSIPDRNIACTIRFRFPRLNCAPLRSLIYRPPQSHYDNNSNNNHTVARYAILAFSDGSLDHKFHLFLYEIRPEIHPVVFIIRLPREIAVHCARPYFEAQVQLPFKIG